MCVLNVCAHARACVPFLRLYMHTLHMQPNLTHAHTHTHMESMHQAVTGTCQYVDNGMHAMGLSLDSSNFKEYIDKQVLPVPPLFPFPLYPLLPLPLSLTLSLPLSLSLHRCLRARRLPSSVMRVRCVRRKSDACIVFGVQPGPGVQTKPTPFPPTDLNPNTVPTYQHRSHLPTPFPPTNLNPNTETNTVPTYQHLSNHTLHAHSLAIPGMAGSRMFTSRSSRNSKCATAAKCAMEATSQFGPPRMCTFQMFNQAGHKDTSCTAHACVRANTQGSERNRTREGGRGGAGTEDSCWNRRISLKLKNLRGAIFPAHEAFAL
jgi:hypothetical protein